MQVNEAMTNDVKIASPNQSIRDPRASWPRSTPACCRSERTINWSA
jgi:hypothetical protein